jgi:hypothetical protein
VEFCLHAPSKLTSLHAHASPVYHNIGHATGNTEWNIVGKLSSSNCIPPHYGSNTTEDKGVSCLFR